MKPAAQLVEEAAALDKAMRARGESMEWLTAVENHSVEESAEDAIEAVEESDELLEEFADVEVTTASLEDVPEEQSDDKYPTSESTDVVDVIHEPSSESETESYDTVSDVDAFEPESLPETAIDEVDSAVTEDIELTETGNFESPEMQPADQSSATDYSPPAKTGLQSYSKLPDTTQSQIDMQEMESFDEQSDERVNRQIEIQMRSNDDLAEKLALELGPQFDEMRAHQTQVTHDFVNEQSLITSYLRDKG